MMLVPPNNQYSSHHYSNADAHMTAPDDYVYSSPPLVPYPFVVDMGISSFDPIIENPKDEDAEMLAAAEQQDAEDQEDRENREVEELLKQTVDAVNQRRHQDPIAETQLDEAVGLPDTTPDDYATIPSKPKKFRPVPPPKPKKKNKAAADDETTCSVPVQPSPQSQDNDNDQQTEQDHVASDDGTEV